MILLIDNYDSFTHNLFQYLAEVENSGREIRVVRNDQISVAEVESLNPSHIVLSPGPCTPNEAGICLDVIARLHARFPILGVCLGHQAIGQAFGGKVKRARRVFHGKTSRLGHANCSIFSSLPQGFVVTRYHSLLVEADSLPSCLEVLAWTLECPQEEIMAFRHRQFPHTIGLQFHPEAILTEFGKELLARFLQQ